MKTKDEVWHALMTTYGIDNLVDVIMYRNYANAFYNRGYVFLEFRTHEEASRFRARFHDKLVLFGKQLMVDWSIPTMDQNEEVLNEVKILFLRNLEVPTTSDEFSREIYKLIDRRKVEKIYKFKNYAFVHLYKREDAEYLLQVLQRVYENTHVEVLWSNPPNKFTSRSFRKEALISRRKKLCVSEGSCAAMDLSDSSSSISTVSSYEFAVPQRSPLGFNQSLNILCPPENVSPFLPNLPTFPNWTNPYAGMREYSLFGEPAGPSHIVHANSTLNPLSRVFYPSLPSPRLGVDLEGMVSNLVKED